MNAEREFALGDILSVTTGIVVSRDGFQGVMRVMGFLYEGIGTIAMAMMAEPCKQALLAQHPQLASVSARDLNPGDDAESWLREQESIFGSTLTLVL